MIETHAHVNVSDLPCYFDSFRLLVRSFFSFRCFFFAIMRFGEITQVQEPQVKFWLTTIICACVQTCVACVWVEKQTLNWHTQNFWLRASLVPTRCLMINCLKVTTICVPHTSLFAVRRLCAIHSFWFSICIQLAYSFFPSSLFFHEF